MVNKKTKIVCTIGPSSWDPKVLAKMVKNGMNVARINAAFSDIPELKRVAEMIRNISTDVALMLDIKGSDIRLNKFPEPINLSKGMELIIGETEKDPIYSTNYPKIYQDLKPGTIVFFDDGYVKAKVEAIKNKKIHLKILEGKVLKPGKSLNVPGVFLNIPAVTKRDKEQIDFCVEDKWDFVAASFIRNIQDAKEVKNYLKGTNLKVIAKIEDGMGVENIDDIIRIMDGIMVARGDMGVEMPFERLPLIQKLLIQKCNQAAKPVITATQVLESMIQNQRPTRAEISDTANAIWDGTDAIMTSGETSAGMYPAETVETITRIAVEVEKTLFPNMINDVDLNTHEVADTALANAALELTKSVEVTKIIVTSRIGSMPKLLARYNFEQDIYAFVDDHTISRQLQLTKNVFPYFFPKKYKDMDDAIKGIIEYSLELGIIDKSDKLLLIGRSLHKHDTFYPNLFEYIDMKEFDNN